MSVESEVIDILEQMKETYIRIDDIMIEALRWGVRYKELSRLSERQANFHIAPVLKSIGYVKVAKSSKKWVLSK